MLNPTLRVSPVFVEMSRSFSWPICKGCCRSQHANLNLLRYKVMPIFYCVWLAAHASKCPLCDLSNRNSFGNSTSSTDVCRAQLLAAWDLTNEVHRHAPSTGVFMSECFGFTKFLQASAGSSYSAAVQEADTIVRARANRFTCTTRA